MNIAKTAIIDPSVKLGLNVTIRDFVVIYPGVTISDNVEIMESSVIGRLPNGAGATSREVEREFGEVIIGSGSVISNHVSIYTDTIIGENTLIGDGASIREKCRIGDKCIISRLVTINYNTTIGNGTKIMDGTHITGNMFIGDNVFISVNVASTNDNNLGKYSFDQKRVVGPRIMDGAMIGAGANLLPGIEIGKNAIVGAGSVVTKNVEENTLVMGVPARLVRKL